MMTFGWSPMQSFLASPQQVATGQTTATQQAVEQTAPLAVTCPTANWFYMLLAIGAALGLAKRK